MNVPQRTTVKLIIEYFDRKAGPLLDCEQSLIFLCKVTAREIQARERRSDKQGRKLEKK